MKKPTKIVIGVVAVIAIIAVIVAVVFINKGAKENQKTNLPQVNSAEDLTAIINKVYEGETSVFPSTQTQTIDVTDNELVQAFTGLENGNDLEYLAVSEPMISSQAYSFVLAKVKDGVNANEVAKQMSEKVNTRKWICVSAEKLYATNSGNIVCLVMANEQMAQSVYGKFKTLAGTTGQEYEKTEQLDELPPEMY